MTSDQITKNAAAIRLILTSIVIAEYGLIRLVDGTKQDLKLRVKNAIASCRRVQQYFLTHENASKETKETFREQFLSDEIVLLSELLETCFGMKPESLEEIISAIKNNTEVTN